MNILKRMRRMAKFTAEQVADYLGISQTRNLLQDARQTATGTP